MRFPKPSFDALVLNYDTRPESVHDCPFIYRKNPVSINTCAVRMSEALVLANGLVESREALTALTNKAGDGKRQLLGKFGYLANLCLHGLSGSRPIESMDGIEILPIVETGPASMLPPS